MATAATSLLDSETFSASSERDAVNRVLSAISPDNSEVIPPRERTTMSYGFTRVPPETDFLTTFGVEPVESAPQDGFWCYSFESESGDAVRLSFNTHERSVQTVWESRGRTVCTVVHENADEIRISDEGGEAMVCVDFAHERDECRTQLEVQVLPDLKISWSSLRT